MIYQIRKNQDEDYTLQIGGTERQVERLADYFKVKLPYSGMRSLTLNTQTKKKAQKMVDEIPSKLAKIKRDISYVYSVKYYGSAEHEYFADCRYKAILKILNHETDEITNLAQAGSNTPVVPKLIKNEAWQGGAYQNKVWQIGKTRKIEFSKKPNNYFTFVKNRHHYHSIFD